MPAGTASSARSRESRSNPQVPTAITATMTRLISGSSHSQPVAIIASAATTTASDTAASAAMCRKAPLMLMSRLRPDMNSSAVSPLMTTPIAATTTTSWPATGCGSAKRRIASQAMAPVTTSSSTALASEAMIEDFFRP